MLSGINPIIRISSEEVESSPYLILEVVESSTLDKGTMYKIDAAGYTESKRGARDGCTYMGTAEFNEKTGNCPNDIVAPSDEIGMGHTHLLIQYNPGSKSYFIKDFGQGTGTFIKIEKPLTLREGYIISYGDSHMYVNEVNDEKIQLKFLDGPKADQILYMFSYS